MKEEVFTNFVWRLFERIGAIGVTFVVSIVIARVIGPASYGVVSIVTILISFFQIFVDGGLSSALIQKKEISNVDYSSIFFVNIFNSIVIYGAVFVLAPKFSSFYNMPELEKMIRVLGISILIFGVKSVQQAYVSRNMQFKKFFYSTLIGTVCAAVIGINMAYRGFGAWALISQYLVNNFIDTFVLWVTVGWRPKLEFSIKETKELFSYGWKLLVSNIIDNIYTNANELLIGKIYSTTDLSYYDKGRSYPNAIVTNISSSLDSVLFPSLSRMQNDVSQAKDFVKDILIKSTSIMLPMMFWVAGCSKSIISILLTEEWNGSAIFLSIFSIIFAFYPINTLNLNITKAAGKSDIFLKLEILKKIIGIVVLIVTVSFGPLAIAIGNLFTVPVSLYINSFSNKKIINYGFIEQAKDLLPIYILSVAILILTIICGALDLSIYFVFCIQIVVGGVIYICGLNIIGIDIVELITRIINIFMRKNNKKS